MTGDAAGLRYAPGMLPPLSRQRSDALSTASATVFTPPTS